MRSLSFLLIAGVLLLLSLASTVSAENETISISVNVPMNPDHFNSNYPDVTEITDLQVEWDSMDIATGENFTFTFIADNLVNGTEYSFSYEIINARRGDTLDNASHLFIANNTEEYSYNLGGQFPDCLLYTSPSPRDKRQSRMPSSA